jgi:hypothetical protein
MDICQLKNGGKMSFTGPQQKVYPLFKMKMQPPKSKINQLTCSRTALANRVLRQPI